ncbi:uncharacterized protein LOC134034115 [Osmerus eperlanus]|uniref:uncharacterized protein LOC134034115 n=1 Tax=Osmerus eperlanus TaxID=29151 RepID=UPI002E1420C1
MTLSMSPAAVCQCFTLVSLCTSIADPNWIQVRNSSDPSGKRLIYGVAFTLHAGQNLTDTGPLGGMNSWGMWLLYVLAALCYSTVLISSSSFLLDFIGGGMSHPRLVVSLHITTVSLLLCALGVCGACLYIIHHNLQEGRLGLLLLWDWGPRWGPGLGHPTRDRGRGDGEGAATGMQPYPGESFYIAGLGLLFSGMASIISIKGLGNMQLDHTHRGYTAVEEEEHCNTEPLTPREPAQGAEIGEEWREVFPE